jgi:cobalt-zinc-cadmium efflux system membrane fusion protein
MTAAELERDHVAEDDVKRRGIDDVLVSSGRLSFDEGRVAHITSPVSGRVVRIDGNLGQHVDKGQILALLKSPDLGDATSALAKASADLIASEHAYRRLEGLRAEGGASEAAVEQAQDAWRTARAEVERAQEKVALLHAGRNVTETYPLTAPIAGTILARNVTPGFEIQGTYSGGSQPELFTVGDLDQVWLYADVYESDLGRVHEGQAIDLTVVGIPTAFRGTIDYLADMLDPQTRTARLRCTIDNPEHKLEPEMYGTVRVHVAPVQALAIPRKSIVHLGDQQLVFVDRGAAPDGRTRFERMPVVADETGADPYVPITHGVDENQRIVVSGGEMLSAKL